MVAVSMSRGSSMLVELNVVEQRYQAVLEVLNDGASVTDVARRYEVSRQTVHVWLKNYANEGLAGLVDGSAKPLSCPHQMPPEVEARVVELRRQHPGWGPRSIGHQLAKDGVVPVPGRSSIYRCLVRHRLITPQARKRKRSDYKRSSRSTSGARTPTSPGHSRRTASGCGSAASSGRT